MSINEITPMFAHTVLAPEAPFSRLGRSIAHRQTSLMLHFGVFTRSSKRPANFQQMYSKYTC